MRSIGGADGKLCRSSGGACAASAPRVRRGGRSDRGRPAVPAGVRTRGEIHMRLFRIFGAAAVAVALGVAGLGGAAAARTAAATNGPVRGGTLTYLASNDNRPTLDPVRLGGVPLA